MMLQQPSTINTKLRIKRLAAGLTESQLAEAVAKRVSAATGHAAALDGNYVSKLERGKITWPNGAYRRALRELFNVQTDAELGFFPMRTRRDAERWLPAPDGDLSRVDVAQSPAVAAPRQAERSRGLVASLVTQAPQWASTTGPPPRPPTASGQVTT